MTHANNYRPNWTTCGRTASRHTRKPPPLASGWPRSRRAAAAERAAEHDREALAALRRELDQLRAEAQSEREALRAAHTEQLAQIQRNADERAAVLNQTQSAPTRPNTTETNMMLYR